MEADQYCLKWNNHQSTLLSVFNSLLDSENMADCVLSAEGESIKAHQVVISACSPYLEKLLNDNRTNQFGHPILIFNDLKIEELKAVREYMYKGEVNVSQSNLDSFLKAAQSLQVKGLADQGGGGGGGEEGGGKRKGDFGTDPSKRRRQRRMSREDNCDSESSSCDNSSLVGARMTTAPSPRRSVVPAAPIVKMEERFETPPPSLKTEPPDPQASSQPPPIPHLKTEPETQEPPEPVQDLTLDEDEYDSYEMAGTSQADMTPDMSQWQMDGGSMNSEDFAAAAQAAVMSSQSANNSQDGGGREMYHCPDCSNKYKQKTSLTRHLTYECGKEPAFSCPLCGKKTKLRSNLHKHMIRRHCFLSSDIVS